MGILEALLLGIVQGLTEFLPVSSTAHLTIAGKAMHLISAEHPEDWTAFIAVIQLGTLGAVLAYFRDDIVRITSSFVEDVIVSRRPMAAQSQHTRMGWMIVAGTVPVVVLGIVLKKVIEGQLTKNLWVLASSMAAFALLLWLAERAAKKNRGIDTLTFADSVLIGTGQACALIPGASRSGTTLTAALLLGFDRESAARFSFLLSVPAVFASGVLELKEALPHLDRIPFGALFVGTVVSGAVGYWSIGFLLKYLRTNRTDKFVYYRIAAAAIMYGALIAKFVEP
jgi:undecaprenyl-diphosphatase